ncbi:MFS transporter [Pelagibacterium flavum]|uniref:MFS transporter n=1 Tax=Pelagibacterium flavum TaxID=2984530 RepID=A0ABY6IP57_9HYPH|nr:MFS transporter [Pelagibacterium sp. YIM 151497]UYQ72266.1 MFS transporter [Pelagibacterium sp. YIM 151497]
MSAAISVPVWRGVSYSAGMVALSTLGAAYFVGLFNPFVSEAFGINQATLGLIFSVSTIAAVIPMFLIGRLIDAVSLRRYTIGLLLAFAAACLAIAWSPNLAVFVVGVFFIRLVGDWLFAHAGLTASARFFGTTRMRLSGLTAIGYAVGPMVFPGAALALTATYGWRTAWFAIAAFIVIFAVPACARLLPSAIFAPSTAHLPPKASIRVLDRRILVFLPALMSAPLVFSGLLFHQSVWSQPRGGAEWLSLGLMAYAAAQMSAMFLAGYLAERFSVYRIVAFHALPAAIGLAICTVWSAPWTLVVYLAGAGVATGFTLTLTPLLLIGLYGDTNLGAGRAMIQSVTLVCAAVSTTAMGLWVDDDLGMNLVFGASIAYFALASLLARLGTREQRRDCQTIRDRV